MTSSDPQPTTDATDPASPVPDLRILEERVASRASDIDLVQNHLDRFRPVSLHECTAQGVVPIDECPKSIREPVDVEPSTKVDFHLDEVLLRRSGGPARVIEDAALER